jgi:hypothetical protein
MELTALDLSLDKLMWHFVREHPKHSADHLRNRFRKWLEFQFALEILDLFQV